VSERPAPTDAAIRAMLTDRADRAGPFRIDVTTVIASAGPRAARGVFRGRRIERLYAGAAMIAAVVVAAVLVAGPLAAPPAGSPGPTSASSSTGPAASSNGPSPSALPEARVLTAAEFGELTRSRSATLAPTVVAVSGTLEADPAVRCLTTRCPIVLAGSGGVHVAQVGDIGPGPWDGSARLTGTFALRTGSVVAVDANVADYIGTLTMPPNGGPAWFVQDLLEGGAHVDGAYAAVNGWLVRDPTHPCASDPRNPVVAYGCPSDDWLSEDQFQPLQENGQSIEPPAAIYLSTGSYDQWAPDPAPAGLGGRGVEPRYATFLMWLVSDGCRQNADCAPPPPRWRIVGRFDPIEVGTASPDAGPTPSPVAVSNGPSPTGGVWTIAQLLEERPPTTTDYQVDGWLEGALTPALRCGFVSTPSGWPRHDCGGRDWLTDAPFSPSPTYAEPAVGIPLQSGAYDAFAPNPAWADLLAEPRFGRYIIRIALHSTCEAAVPQPGASCAGGPVWTFELVGRAPP
jgi:hypothetical protein